MNQLGLGESPRVRLLTRRQKAGKIKMKRSNKMFLFIVMIFFIKRAQKLEKEGKMKLGFLILFFFLVSLDFKFSSRMLCSLSVLAFNLQSTWFSSLKDCQSYIMFMLTKDVV